MKLSLGPNVTADFDNMLEADSESATQIGEFVLVEKSLDEGTLNYTAISYRWGSSAKHIPLRIMHEGEERILFITKSAWNVVDTLFTDELSNLLNMYFPRYRQYRSCKIFLYRPATSRTQKCEKICSENWGGTFCRLKRTLGGLR